MMVITLLISFMIYWAGNRMEVNLYWLNTGILVSIVGVAAYYRYKEYEKNKGV
jgi:hypothetical protein